MNIWELHDKDDIIKRVLELRGERDLQGKTTPRDQKNEYLEGIRKLHELGMSASEMGERLSRHHTTILHHLSKMGLSELKKKESGIATKKARMFGVTKLKEVNGRTYGRTDYKQYVKDFGDEEKVKAMIRLDKLFG